MSLDRTSIIQQISYASAELILKHLMAYKQEIFRKSATTNSL